MPNTPTNTSSRQTLAIDFDGVIHPYHPGWLDEGRYGEPIEGAKEALEKLLEKYNVVIFTCRPSLGVYVWMRAYDFPKDIHITNKKPRAIAYIDDRAIPFVKWEYILNAFLNDNNQNPPKD